MTCRALRAIRRSARVRRRTVGAASSRDDVDALHVAAPAAPRQAAPRQAAPHQALAPAAGLMSHTQAVMFSASTQEHSHRRLAFRLPDGK